MNEEDANRRPILIVDDEPGVLRAVSTALTGAGFRILITVEDSRDVMKIMADNKKVGVVILDLRMPHVSGQELLAEIRRLYPRVPVIILTANDDIESAVQCMKLGAYDYQVKPVDNTKLIRTVRNAQEMHELRHEIRTLRHHMILHDLENEEAFSEMVTVSGHMYGIFRYCEAIAKSGEPILITGEDGTGRSLLARVIHGASGREGKPVSVNAAGMDEAAFAAAVFGTETVTSPGEAPQETPGALAGCVNGTLIIKNVQSLGDDSQKRLIRLLEDKTYIPQGAGMARRASVRVIAIAGMDLANSVQEGRFRRDLSAKLQDHHVEMPALRERREDIPFLLNHFAEFGASRLGTEKPPVPAELISRLMSYDFPGNIPELEDLVTKAIRNYAKGISLMDTFQETLGTRLPVSGSGYDTAGSADALVRVFGHFPTVEEAVDHLIDSALKVTDGNKKAAADILQITRQTINRRLRLKR